MIKKIKYTEEQSAAINHDCGKTGSVIISAAAGSGKTAVLVEHIIKMICDTERRIPAEKIAAVTFTKKAAAEMRERLETALKERYYDAGTVSEREWLNEQLIRLDDARITTISAFCLEILRIYSVEAGLNAGFRNLDEIEADEFFAAATDNVLEILYDGITFTDEETGYLNTLTGEIGDNALALIIREFHKAAVKQPEPFEWADNAYKSTDVYLPLLIEIIEEKAEMFLTLAEENKKIAFGTKIEAKLENDYNLANDWKNWGNTLKDGEALTKSKLSDKLKNGLKNLLTRDCERAAYGKSFSETDLNTLKENQKEYKKLIKELCEWGRLFLAAEKAEEKIKPAVQTLTKLYKMTAEEFMRMKLAANAIDFNDVEHLCLSLLKADGGRIAKELSAGIHELIVDEFQDSNGIQYAIFTALSREGHNLYLVGDIKQSIYRFRNADPRVFGAVLRDENFKVLHLDLNFRSGKEVIDAVNGIFYELMTERLGGTDYNMVCCSREENSDCGDMSAELCILLQDDNRKNETENDADNTDNINNSDNTENADAKKIEAAYIAGRIKSMVESGFKITDKNKETRPCRYGDFVVIISALGTVEKEFTEAFEEEGIPFERGGSGDYLRLREIGLALDLLTVIDNPYAGDLALLSVLMSPLYNMSADDLARIKAESMKDNVKNGFYESLLIFTADEGNKKYITAYEKSRRFLDDIFRWRAFAENNSPSLLIRSIYDECMFLPLAAGAENGIKAEKTLANLRLLLYYADNLSGLSGLDVKNLSGFISFLNDKLDKGKRLEEAAPSTDESAVKLLTIHASKGLEFPICFVARTNSVFNKRDSDADIIFDNEYGIAGRYVDLKTLRRYETLTRRIAKRRTYGETESEEIRKLYVAVTRARNKLILTGVVKEGKSGEIKIKSNSYLEWLYNSNAAKNETLKIIYPDFNTDKDEVEREKAEEIKNENEKIKIEESGNILSGSADISNFSDFSENLEKEVSKAIKMDYSGKPLTAFPKKLTATQIGVTGKHYISGIKAAAEEESDEPGVFPRNPSFLREKKLTGKKRGDCYHKLMRLIDFEAGGYEEQIKNLEDRFTKEEYKAINVSDILGFFESGLGKRAAASRKVYKEFPLYTELDFTDLFGKYMDYGQEDKKIGEELDLRFSERPFVQGVADMFFYENNGIVLVDYKTNRRPTEESLRGEYQNQLRVYKKAIEEMTGERVKECWIYSFEIGAVLL